MIMLSILTLIAAVGISIESIIPALIGALIKTSKDKTNTTLASRLISVFSGIATAAFITPIVMSITGLEGNMTAGVAFGLGYLGLNVVEFLFEKLKK